MLICKGIWLLIPATPESKKFKQKVCLDKAVTLVIKLLKYFTSL